MCNGNKMMYTRVIRSESRLVAAEKVIFIHELIYTIKDQFSKILEQMGKRDTVR